MRYFPCIFCSLVLLSATVRSDEDNASTPDIHRIPDPESGRGALTLVLMPASDALRTELGITIPQLEKLRELQAATRKADNEILRSWSRQVGNQDLIDADMKNKFRAVNERLLKDIAGVLRPAQFQRLCQIEFQQTTMFHLLVPLSSSSVMTELALAADEQSRFALDVKNCNAALQRTVLDLQQRVPDKLAELVTPEQRQKLEELVGEPLNKVAFYDHAESQGIGYRNAGMSSILLSVRSPIIAQHLEVLDEQAAQITVLWIENRRLERDVLQKQAIKQREATRLGKGDLGPPVEDLKALREAFDKRLAEILLPHQIERLKQLDVQIRVAREAALPLLSKTAATAIGLSEEKQQELQEAYVRESHAVQQDRDRAYYKALDELLKTLSPDQQKRYHLLVGKRFDKWFQ